VVDAQGESLPAAGRGKYGRLICQRCGGSFCIRGIEEVDDHCVEG